MKYSALVALLFLFFATSVTQASVTSPPLDEEVQILIIREEGLSASWVNAQVDRLNLHWNNTRYSTGNDPVPLTVVNQTLPLLLPDISGPQLEQLIAVNAFVTAPILGGPSIRDSVAADLVVMFVDHLPPPAGSPPGTVNCGWAPAAQWLLTGFDNTEDPDGLDRRGKDLSYVALISAETPCDGALSHDLTAHEVGHLFGAGHYEYDSSNPSDSTKTGIFQNSRSNVKGDTIFGFTIWYRTAMSSQSDRLCDGASVSCIPGGRFSDNYFFFSDPGRRNSDAIEATSESVANYRQGPAAGGSGGGLIVTICIDGLDNDGDGDTDGDDEDCQNGFGEASPPPPPPPVCNSLNRPTSLFGYLVRACVEFEGGSESQYRAHWEHPCPSEVDEYEVLTSVPFGNPYLYGWTKQFPTTDIFVNNTTGAIRVRSCGPAGCSLPSTGFFVAADICPN